MPNQDAIDGVAFNALSEGLYAHYITDGHIDHARWLRAHAESSFVGTCRLCGSNLRPNQPYTNGTLTWYEAVCIKPSCAHIYASPGTRTLRRSSAHSEAPGGWWEHRNRKRQNGGAS